MFTGIVEEVGRLQEVADFSDCKSFIITAQAILSDIHVGDSIAVNGVCLTVVDFDQGCFAVEAVPETLRLTNVGALQAGDRVNLERAMLAAQRLGGHLVQGHIEGTAKLLKIAKEGDALMLNFSMPDDLYPYIVGKGFITLDGMSLTVVSVTTEHFQVTIVPHTQKATIVQYYQPGCQVNIETDIVGKYIEHMLAARGMQMITGEAR